MRLAFDCTFALSPTTGVGAFAHAVLERLRARSDIDVVGYAVAWRATDDVRAATEGLTVPRRSGLLNPRWSRAAWTRVNAPQLEWVTGRVDVVHGPNYLVPPTRSAAAVVSVHDLTFLLHPQWSTDDTRAFTRLVRRAVGRGAWVHTDTNTVRDEVIEHFGADPERVRTVPLAAAALPAGDLPGADADSGRGLAGGDRFILAVGTIEPRKNLPRLVAAFDRIADDDPDIRLVIAGPDGWGTDALEGALVAARHSNRVVRTGWVDPTQRASLMRAATVLAYPSLYEGFGMPPLEAMSVGTPVVAGRVGALEETCGPAAVFADPSDTDDLARVLTEVLGNDDARATLGALGQAWAAGFTWDRTTEGLVGLYGDAVAGRSR